ncbi:hypothetical protein BS614_05250 [Paenibacillus xylanexedens]|nr:hypothetical protein BS614_05250 [Paenibacillus xylanexedens]
MKNYKLRLAWIIPLIFLVILDISIIIYTVLHWGELGMVSNMAFLLLSLLMLAVILFGFYRIRKWIRSGLI